MQRALTLSLASSALIALLLTTSALAGPKPDAVAGKAIYEAQCLICHGGTGDGAGPAGAAMKPKPTDLTTAAFWQEKTEAELMTAIRQGSPGTAMQGYNKLTREELQNLVAYLQGFAPK